MVLLPLPGAPTRAMTLVGSASKVMCLRTGDTVS